MRARRTVAAMMAAGLAAGLAGCATGPARFPVEATRFHYDPVAERGTVRVEPLTGPTAAPSLEYQAYAGAVEGELARLGFVPAPAGANPQFIATVSFARSNRPLPPRRSPVQIGIGGGSYSGGWHGGGGVGGGVSFPLGGGGARDGIITELSVRLRRGPDAVWEGRAQSLTDSSAPDAGGDAIARRLAAALFLGFPGESGRTISVP
jgi:diadenosine tetraphosphatase ApaH/serine/threonine PP2A family protein phosphatase